MKRSVTLLLPLFICLSATGAALGQQGWEFSIIGTWKAATTGATDAVLYRFDSNGVVTALSISGSGPTSEPREVARAAYELDNPKAPKFIALTTTNRNRVFRSGRSSMKIITYTDASLTLEISGSEPTRWTKVDPNRYFIVLTARKGEFSDSSGPAFPILIKIFGRESQVDAVGIYSDQGSVAFAKVPPNAYKDLMREPQTVSGVMLRLEINSAQYERGLKILRTWERRVREGALLYPASPLNNILLVKTVTETLNQCGEEIRLYKLTYIQPEDWISDQYGPALVPFFYFKELRKLNESLHVRDDKFQQAFTAFE